MNKLKDFKTFIKENKFDQVDILNNQTTNDTDDDILMNMKNLPSELWTEEMIDINAKYENIYNKLDNNIENDNEYYYDEEPDEKKMIHKKEENIIESFSEKEYYELKNIFEEEEEEKEEND